MFKLVTFFNIFSMVGINSIFVFTKFWNSVTGCYILGFETGVFFLQLLHQIHMSLHLSPSLHSAMPTSLLPPPPIVTFDLIVSPRY